MSLTTIVVTLIVVGVLLCLVNTFYVAKSLKKNRRHSSPPRISAGTVSQSL